MQAPSFSSISCLALALVSGGVACGSNAAVGPGTPDATASATNQAPDGATGPEPDGATHPASDAGGLPSDGMVGPSDAGGDGAADAGVPSQDVTFFVFGDPQFGGADTDKNAFNIQALNAAPALVWPSDAGFLGAGQAVGDPRGVVIAGDLTQNGQAGRDSLMEWYTQDAYAIDVNAAYGANWTVPRVAAELGLFLRDYGLRGNDGLDAFVLKWRVFEGYGNHDFDILEHDSATYGGQAPARDIVSVRNAIRASWPEMRRFAAGTAGHYSWDWDSTHFVHVNLVASDSIAANADDDSGSQMFRDPQGALAFLQQDLAQEVGTSCRPVVVIMHYGFDAFSDEGCWWDEAQRLAFLDVIGPYNVVAILHGHVHETRAYTMADAFGKTYDVFSLGSPFYNQGTNNGHGHFAVFHLKGTHIDAADISWLPADPSPAMADGKDLWSGKTLANLAFQTTTTFAGGWGGWAFSKDIDTGRCGWQGLDAGLGASQDGEAGQDGAPSCAYATGSYAQSCTGCATYASPQSGQAGQAGQGTGICELGCESCTKIDGTQNGNPSLVLPCSGDVGNDNGALVCNP